MTGSVAEKRQGADERTARPASSSGMKRVGKYKLTKEIGRGGFAVVYHATDTETKSQFAVKMCEKAQLVATGMLGELENEIAVLKRIRSRHIANLADVIQTGRYYYLVLDLCDTTLFNLIVSSPFVAEGRRCLREEQSRECFQGLLLAVYACHQLGVMHRDIKPENILVTARGEVKLSDFGFACPVEKMDSVRAQCGTRQYLAPEILDSAAGEGVSVDGFAADVWACGVTLYVMVCGRLPFGDPREEAGRRQLRAAQFKLGAHVGSELANIITRVLMPDPQLRPSIFQIMETDWFQTKFDQQFLEDINSEVREQRAMRIVMNEKFSRHVPATLLDCDRNFSTPPMVDSYNYLSTSS
eukprot:Hpha_TRINITY_DN16307_c2_g3::TRINITY_DN16307_c2_g3_i1::g.59356::m.59356